MAGVAIASVSTGNVGLLRHAGYLRTGSCRNVLFKVFCSTQTADEDAEKGRKRYKRGSRNARRFWMSRSDVTNHNQTDVVNHMRWFPYDDNFKVDDQTSLTSAEVIETMKPLMVEDRKQKFETVASNRTFSICPVIEGLFDVGNISAVIRTAEAFGLQSVHVIANCEDRYKEGRNISMGTEKWLDVEIWDTTKECFQALKSRGYRIAVAQLTDNSVSIHEMDWTVPTAIIFGNEHRGVTEEAACLCDVVCSIPMTGMVDSFNVSVAAGIFMYHVVNDRLARTGTHGDLTKEQQQILCAEFFLRHKRKADSIIDCLVSKKRGESNG